MSRVTLIRPNARNKNYQSLSKDVAAIEPPLWMALRASHLREKENAEVKVIDMEVRDSNFNEISSDEVEIFLTGNHPSSFIQNKQSVIDLQNRLAGKDVKVWDTLPYFDKDCMPDWDLFEMDKYRAHNWHSWSGTSQKPYGTLYTSLSCPYNCKFCCVKSYYVDPYKQRPVKDIIRDIDDMVVNYSIKNIKVVDELFSISKKRVEEICDILIDRNYGLNIWIYERFDTIKLDLLLKLKKAGFNWIALGIESGNGEIRKNNQKGKFTNNDIREVVKILKDNGINVFGNYIFGFPEDNLQTMEETLNLAKELKCEYSNFYCMVAYPNSELYDYAVDRGWELPREWNQYSQFSYDFLPLPTNYLSSKEVLQFRDNAFLDFFTSRDYLSMMEDKFGEEVVEELADLVKIKLKRNLLGT